MPCKKTSKWEDRLLTCSFGSQEYWPSDRKTGRAPDLSYDQMAFTDFLGWFILLFASSRNRRPQRQKLHVSGTGKLVLVRVIIVVGWAAAVVVIAVKAMVGVMTVAAVRW